MKLKKFLMALIFSLLIGLNTCAAEDEILAFSADADPWILALARDNDDGNIYFLIMNHQTVQGAIVPYERRLYDFYLNNSSPLIFIMAVMDSPRDVDSDLGEWANSIHLLPVYAPFKYANGKVTLDSPLSSCNGLSASHYQRRRQSPYHTKLAEIFLTQMPALHKDAESKGVNLP